MSKSFYVQPLSLWRIAFPIGVAGAVVGRSVRWLVDGLPFSWPVSIALVLFVACAVGLVAFFQPTVITPEGLKAFNTLGLRKFAAWSDVEAVSLHRQFRVLPSFRLQLASGRVLWLPRSMMKLREMHECVCTYAGNDHPLARALRTPLYLA